jgi:membrane-bound metal-dependent hydrolase YbcI (DUF457 family)
VILGHLTVTAAGHHITRRFWPALPVSLGALVLGAYLPDLVDKPIAFMTGLGGRGYAHSLVVQAFVFGSALAFVERRHAPLVATLAAGSVLHLLEDGPPPGVLLAPLLGPIPHDPPGAFFARIVRYYTTPSVHLALEAAAAAYWLAVGTRAVYARVRAGAARAVDLVSAPPRDPA